MLHCPEDNEILIGERIQQQEKSKKKDEYLYQCSFWLTSCVILSAVPLCPAALSSTEMSEDKHSDLDLL